MDAISPFTKLHTCFWGSTHADLHSGSESSACVSGRKEFDGLMLPVLGQNCGCSRKPQLTKSLKEWQFFGGRPLLERMAVFLWGTLPKMANQIWFWIASKLLVPKSMGRYGGAGDQPPQNMSSWDVKHFRIIAEIWFVHRSSYFELGFEKSSRK